MYLLPAVCYCRLEISVALNDGCFEAQGHSTTLDERCIREVIDLLTETALIVADWKGTPWLPAVALTAVSRGLIR